MKLTIQLFLPLASVALLLMSPARSGAQTNSSGALPVISALGPRIEFAARVHDFGMMTSGVTAKYDFVFTNTGDAVLTCEVYGLGRDAKWDQRVAPGQTGKIPLSLKPAHFSGPFTRPITVVCNDTNHPTTVLQVKAAGVWAPIEVAPWLLTFSASATTVTNETRTVRILNHTADPLTLSAPECRNPSLRAELKTVREGKEFELLLTRVSPFAEGTGAVPITIKTSCKDMPMLRIEAWSQRPAL